MRQSRQMMDARRYDIMPRGTGWWLSDSGVVGLPFVTETEAINKARTIAREGSALTTIYAWRHGEPIELYRIAAHLTVRLADAIRA